MCGYDLYNFVTTFSEGLVRSYRWVCYANVKLLSLMDNLPYTLLVHKQADVIILQQEIGEIPQTLPINKSQR